MKTIIKTTMLILCCLAFAGSDIKAQNGTIEATEGVIVGNNTGLVAGTIRWTGTDFQGYNGSNWVSLTNLMTASGTTFISDTDSDTKIETEKLTDDDMIRYTVEGKQFASMDGQTFFLESTGQSLFIGRQAGTNDNGTNNFNTAVGYESLFKNTTGDNNTALGHSSLTTNSTGSRNTAVGKDALKQNNIGNANTATGYQALNDNTSGKENTAFGESALANNSTASSNTAVGFHSLINNTTGEKNTAVGKDALLNNTTGFDNIAMGNEALSNNTTGERNVAVGKDALKSHITGKENTAIGNLALSSHKTGDWNTAIGNEALLSKTQGVLNTAVGNHALSAHLTGNANTAIGAWAMSQPTDGSQNVAVGFYSLIRQRGSNNTGLGFNTGAAANGPIMENTTSIGNEARVTASNQVRIGNAKVTSIGGEVGWTALSDGRFKTNVKEDIKGLAFINGLRPVSYNMDIQAFRKFLGFEVQNNRKDNSEAKRTFSETQTGFIAQEVHALAKEMDFEFSGIDAPKNDIDYYGLRYGSFVVPLVKAVQELSAQNEFLHKENQALIESNAALKTRMDRLETMLTNLDDKY